MYPFGLYTRYLRLGYAPFIFFSWVYAPLFTGDYAPLFTWDYAPLFTWDYAPIFSLLGFTHPPGLRPGYFAWVFYAPNIFTWVYAPLFFIRVYTPLFYLGLRTLVAIQVEAYTPSFGLCTRYPPFG
jgi:hypothetical protein